MKWKKLVSERMVGGKSPYVVEVPLNLVYDRIKSKIVSSLVEAINGKFDCELACPEMESYSCYPKVERLAKRYGWVAIILPSKGLDISKCLSSVRDVIPVAELDKCWGRTSDIDKGDVPRTVIVFPIGIDIVL